MCRVASLDLLDQNSLNLPERAHACVPDGGGCNVDSDCCDAEFCDYGACSVCVSSGNGCNFDSDCCSGYCDPNGFCG